MVSENNREALGWVGRWAAPAAELGWALNELCCELGWAYGWAAPAAELGWAMNELGCELRLGCASWGAWESCDIIIVLGVSNYYYSREEKHNDDVQNC